MIEVRSAEDSDVDAMAVIYVNAARAGWAPCFVATLWAASQTEPGPD